MEIIKAVQFYESCRTSFYEETDLKVFFKKILILCLVLCFAFLWGFLFFCSLRVYYTVIKTAFAAFMVNCLL